MAKLADLKLAYRAYMRGYSYRRIDWTPGAMLSVPLAEARICVVTTAGFTLPGQVPFDATARGGDWSFREIPADADVRRLLTSHKSDAFDRTGIDADANLALPLDRLRERRGRLATVHFSFMGSITAPERLMDTSGPEVVRRVAESGADAVLLTPV